MSNYSLTFINNSDQEGDACVYQQDPDLGVENVQSLAWFTKAADPTTQVEFDWSIDYSYVWSETGDLVPGVVFTASQAWAADLSSTNQVTLTNNGAFTFENQTAGAEQGSLYITEDGTIPVSVASVGIGMSGFGTFAVNAEPNYNLVFTPHPEYWITFGTFSQGEVMDISESTNAAEILFPANVYAMTATLNADNTWTISQS